MIALSGELLTLILAVRAQYIPSPKTTAPLSLSSISKEPIKIDHTRAWALTGSTNIPSLVARTSASYNHDTLKLLKRHIGFEESSEEAWRSGTGIFNEGYSQDRIYDWAPVGNPGYFSNFEEPPTSSTETGSKPLANGSSGEDDNSNSPRDFNENAFVSAVEGIARSPHETRLDHNAERNGRSVRKLKKVDANELAHKPTSPDFVTEEEMIAVRKVMIEARECSIGREMAEQGPRSRPSSSNESLLGYSVSESLWTHAIHVSASSSAASSEIQKALYVTKALIATEEDEIPATGYFVETAGPISEETPNVASVSQNFDESESGYNNAEASTMGTPSVDSPNGAAVTTSLLTATSMSNNPSTFFTSRAPFAETMLEESTHNSQSQAESASPITDDANALSFLSSDMGHAAIPDLATPRLPKEDDAGDNHEITKADEPQDSDDQDTYTDDTDAPQEAPPVPASRESADQPLTPGSDIRISAHELLYRIASNSMTPNATVEEAIFARSFKYMYEKKFQTPPAGETRPGEMLLMFLRGETAASNQDVKRYEQIFDSVFKQKFTDTTPFLFGDMSKLPQFPF